MIRELFKQYNKHFAKYISMKNKVWRVVSPGSNIRMLDPTTLSQWSIILDMTIGALLKGQVVAIPTDTLYGLVTLAEHSDKLYKIKRRASHKPLGLFLYNAASVKKYCVQTVPDELLEVVYPGPVTLLFERTGLVPLDFNPGVNAVGIRVPQARFVRDLCYRLPFRLLAQTSANVSGGRSPLRIQDFEEIWNDIDLIIDAGPIMENDGAEEGSTVIDLSVPGQYKMIRDGCAPFETKQLLNQFGIRPAEEIAREQLREAGKRLRMLEIVANEITPEEEQRMEEEEGKKERDNGRKEGKEGESVEEEESGKERKEGESVEEEESGKERKEGESVEKKEEEDINRKQKRADCG